VSVWVGVYHAENREQLGVVCVLANMISAQQLLAIITNICATGTV